MTDKQRITRLETVVQMLANEMIELKGGIVRVGLTSSVDFLEYWKAIRAARAGNPAKLKEYLKAGGQVPKRVGVPGCTRPKKRGVNHGTTSSREAQQADGDH